MTGSYRPALHLVTSRTDDYRIGTVRLSVFSPRSAHPCDAIVIEEDSWQILAAGSDFTPCSEHPIRVWTELLDTKPLPAGTVLLREGWPLTMVAVVYDFDLAPCCRSRGVSTALAEIFRICRQRQVHSLLLPLPGVRHARISLRKSLRLVLRALRREPDLVLRRVMLACTSEEEEAMIEELLPAESALWSRSRT